MLSIVFSSIYVQFFVIVNERSHAIINETGKINDNNILNLCITNSNKISIVSIEFRKMLLLPNI